MYKNASRHHSLWAVFLIVPVVIIHDSPTIEITNDYHISFMTAPASAIPLPIDTHFMNNNKLISWHCSRQNSVEIHLQRRGCSKPPIPFEAFPVGIELTSVAEPVQKMGILTWVMVIKTHLGTCFPDQTEDFGLTVEEIRNMESFFFFLLSFLLLR